MLGEGTEQHIVGNQVMIICPLLALSANKLFWDGVFAFFFALIFWAHAEHTGTPPKLELSWIWLHLEKLNTSS